MLRSTPHRPHSPARAVLAASLMCLVLACAGERPRTGVHRTSGLSEAVLLEYPDTLESGSLPDGWYHHHFRTHGPMSISLDWHRGEKVIRLQTQDTASMLFRQVDVELDRHPVLTWAWRVDDGIASSYDEKTHRGDDHPIRIYLTFLLPDGDTRSLQLIWGNRLPAGERYELSYLGGLAGPYPHVVIAGGREQEGSWRSERVALHPLVAEMLQAPDATRLVEIALFADSDQTGDSTSAWIGPISVGFE